MPPKKGADQPKKKKATVDDKVGSLSVTKNRMRLIANDRCVLLDLWHEKCTPAFPLTWTKQSSLSSPSKCTTNDHSTNRKKEAAPANRSPNSKPKRNPARASMKNEN